LPSAATKFLAEKHEQFAQGSAILVMWICHASVNCFMMRP